MSDPYREQRPLLCDEYSDEEFHIKNYYHKRNQPSVCIGRARAHAKGAAAVLTRWPDNCSTSVAYWWLGAAMIAVTIFVIYNSVLIFGMIPATNLKQPKYRNFNNGIKLKAQTYSLPDVYMHLIVDNDSNVQLNNFFPYIDLISTKYPNFNYKFLVVLNDTVKDVPDFNDDQRNEIALKSLWEKEKKARKIPRKYKISVEHISLTDYLNNSPIKKFWRHLPPHIIQFLMRSISIWEKGGIAFNPAILTPKSSNPNYMEKLYEILNKYTNSSIKLLETKPKAKDYSRINKKRPNNIRDIINALNEDHSNTSELDLNVADSNKVSVVANTVKSLHPKSNINYDLQKSNNTGFNSKENNMTQDNEINSNDKDDNIPNTANYTYTNDNILPLFVKYLFHTRPEKEIITKSELKNDFIPKTGELVFDDVNNYNEDESVLVERASNRSVQPYDNTDRVNISNKLNNEQKERITFNKSDNYDNIPELTIDIKGNIIASKTACHAFLGTIFSSVIHHTGEETLTDFIISELSQFCNGLLTSCAGINVILV